MALNQYLISIDFPVEQKVFSVELTIINTGLSPLLYNYIFPDAWQPEYSNQKSSNYPGWGKLCLTGRYKAAHCPGWPTQYFL